MTKENDAHGMACIAAHKLFVEGYAGTIEIIEAYLTSLASSGYKVTPREPTREMQESIPPDSRMQATVLWYAQHDKAQWPPSPAEEK